MTAIVVRRAGTDDAEWIMGELPAFSRFFGTTRPLFEDETHVRTVLGQLIEHHLVLVATRGQAGERIGFIVGLVVPHPFNPGIRTLTEQLWWVVERHRRSRAALLLLEAFERWGEENVDWITFGFGHRTNVKPKALLRRGYRAMETNFLREVR